MARDQGGQVMVERVADALDRQVRQRVCGEDGGAVGKLSLPEEYGGHAVTPGPLDRGRDPQLVVHQDRVRGQVPSLDILQRLLFVNLDEHMAAFRKNLRSVTLPASRRWRSDGHDDICGRHGSLPLLSEGGRGFFGGHLRSLLLRFQVD